MPPRLRAQLPRPLRLQHNPQGAFICWRCHYATAASATNATTPAPSQSQMTTPLPSISRYSPSQPVSHRPPEFRKSQLLRSYVSLLQSTPLIILFQHNNLKSMEWVSIRREISRALQKVDDSLVAKGR